jgi:O-antigen ligase
VLQIYLFLALSQVDEHYDVFLTFPWRFTFGVLAIVTFVTGIGAHGSVPAPNLFGSPQSRWLVAYFVAGTASMVWAYDATLARLAHVDHGTAILSFFLLVSIVRSPRGLVITLLVIALGAGTYLLVALWEWFHGAREVRGGIIRMVGPGRLGQKYTDPNSFGASIVYAAPFVAWLGVRVRAWPVRLAALAYWPLMTYSVFMTSSRGAMVILVLATAWVLVSLPKGKVRRWGFGLASVLMVVLLMSITEKQRTRLESIFKAETYEEDASTLGRIEGYKVAWKMFEDRPLLGVGPGNFLRYRLDRIDGWYLNPHNLVGQLIGTLGLLGTLTFVGYVVASAYYGLREARRRWRSPDPWDRACAMLCATGVVTLGLMIVSGLAAHNLARPNWFWVPGIMVVAVTCRPTAPVVTTAPRPRRTPPGRR